MDQAGGHISIGRMPPIEGAAVAVNEKALLATLVWREGETFPDLLQLLDVAIGKALHEETDSNRGQAGLNATLRHPSMVGNYPMPAYQLRVYLRGISPPIWRGIIVAADCTIADLHDIIQLSVGWSDDHLHRFVIRGREYGVSRPGGIGIEPGSHRLALEAFGFRVHEHFVYEYDFHCAWLHDIRAEKILAEPAPQGLAVCIAGVGGCPPEESGPAARFMEALDDHSGEDFVEWIEDRLERPDLDRSELCDGLEAWRPWIDRRFDRKAANARLRERRALQ